MEGDEIYQYIYRAKLPLHDRARKIIDEIRKSGKSQSTDKIPRSVHTIIASIKQEVNEIILC